MIFDVKLEDFRQKARLVAGGHQTKAPATITYASVVSRETVCLALTIASLNDLEVEVGDVLNAYITAPVKEKVWTILGLKFGHDSGRSAIIVHALYGLVVRIPTRNLYAVTQPLLTRRNFIFLNSLRGFWKSLVQRSHSFQLLFSLLFKLS